MADQTNTATQTVYTLTIIHDNTPASDDSIQHLLNDVREAIDNHDDDGIDVDFQFDEDRPWEE